MLKLKYPKDLKKFENYDLGYSDWFLIDQQLINAFAKLSGDDQWIHVDTERASNEMPDGISYIRVDKRTGKQTQETGQQTYFDLFFSEDLN